MEKDEWSKVKEFVKSNIGESAHTNWIQPIELKEIKGTVAKFKVPTRFIGTWVHRNYGDHIIQGFKNLKLSISRLEFVTSSDKTSGRSKGSEKSISKKSDQRTEDPQLDLPSSPLDARFTFDKFVVGKPNELAHAAAKRVSDGGKVTFNPLFLYGGVGLGKTHLMNAIAWVIKKKNPDRKVVYISAEKFMYQFIKALRSKDVMNFKQEFRSVDVLMIDDVQFISGKEHTQEEFFHTFNALVDRGCQIVLSADKSPSDLEGMEERLKSRLGWGLVTDIQPTTYELRLGILQSRAESSGITFPREVLDFIAQKIKSNVRELEGALNRIIAHTTLVGKQITLENTIDVLSDILRANNKLITIEDIQKKVSEHFSVKMSEMFSARRSKSVVIPRQVAMYLSKELTNLSYPEIGRNFGGKDHTTIIHASKKIDKLLNENSHISEDIKLLKSILSN